MRNAGLDVGYVHELLDALAAGGDREAIVYGEQRLTSAEAHDLVLRLGAGLKAEGLRSGDAVAVFLGPGPAAILMSYAVHLMGCRLVAVPSWNSVTEAVAGVERSLANVLVVDNRSVAQEAGLAARVPLVLSLGSAGADFGRLGKAGCRQAGGVVEPWQPQNVATLFSTGGTTAGPKLVAHGLGAYRGAVVSAQQLRPPVQSARWLLCTSPASPYAHNVYLTGLLGGATLVLLDRPDAGTVLAAVEREQITGVFLTPPQLCEMLVHPACPPAGFPRLKLIWCSAGPLSSAHTRRVLERFGPVLQKSYGSSEALGVTLMRAEEMDLDRPSTLLTCGRPLPYTRVEIRDEHGGAVPAGEIGTVHIQGPNVMLGYWGERGGTEKALRGGVLRTDDVGYLDREGYLYLLDRSQDVIVTGEGVTVYSQLLDDFLVSLPGVRDAAAVGVAYPGRGASVHAFLVMEPATAPELVEIRAGVRKTLGPSYEPQEVSVLDVLPRTPLVKVDKAVLRSMAKAGASASS